MIEVVDFWKNFSEDELNFLTDNLKEKFNFIAQEILEKFNGLKEENEKQKVLIEQQSFEYEKYSLESQEKIQAQLVEINELQKQLNEYQLKVFDGQDKLTNLVTQIQKEEIEIHALRREKDVLSEERQEFAEMLNRKNNEVLSLSEQLQNLSKELVIANNLKCESLVRMDETVEKEIKLQQREVRFEQEKEFLKKKIDLLNTQLIEIEEQMAVQTRDHNRKYIEVKLLLNEKTEQLETLESQMILQKNEAESLRKREEELIEKLKESRESELQLEESYQKELRVQMRLTDLYKESSEDAESKCCELVSANNELRKLLKEATSTYGDLEEKFLQQKQDAESRFKENEKMISELSRELQDANTLLELTKKQNLTDENLEILSSSTAAGTKLLRSGMSLTQIYSEFVKVSEELCLQKCETQKLQQYLDRILQDIAARTPLLRKQREDYEECLEKLEALTSQMNTAMQENDRLKLDAYEGHHCASQLRKENEKLHIEIKDLRLQVCTLLKEIEESHGGSVLTNEELLEIDTETVTADQVISKHLVTFRDIQELQSQNQQLLITLREISDDKEQKEKEMLSDKTQALKEELEHAWKEVDELRNFRDRQAQIVESIAQQRDMYKSLAQNSSNVSSFHLQSSLTSASENLNERTNAESNVFLKELQEQFESYKTEKFKNEQMLRDSLHECRNQLEQVKLEKCKVEAKLEYGNERLQSVLNNLESTRKELLVIEDKKQQYCTVAARHEETISHLKNDLFNLQQRYSRLEIQSVTLQDELNMCKLHEARIRQENESIQREHRNQALLIANLEALKNNLDKVESESKMKLEDQIKILQKENIALQKKIDFDKDVFHDSLHNWEKENSNLHKELVDLKELYEISKNELESSKEAMLRLREELQDALTKPPLRSITSKQFLSSSDCSRENVKELESRLIEAQSNNDSLNNQLENAKQHIKQYKNIAESLEKELCENNIATQLLKENFESKQTENQKLIVQLETKLREVEHQYTELHQERDQLIEQLKQSKNDLYEELQSCKQKLLDTENRCDILELTKSELKQQIQQYIQTSTESQAKYERELLLHAADIQKLSEMKEMLNGYNTKLEEAVASRVKAEELLKNEKEAWIKHEKILICEQQDLKEHFQTLETQNEYLQNQLELMNNKLSISNALSKDAHLQNNVSSMSTSDFLEIDENNRSSEQLMQIIKYLRKDKDIIRTKLEISSAETNRLQIQTEMLQKKLEESNKALQKIMEDTQITSLTATQHSELLRKVELMATLTDCNRMLREERDYFQKQHHEQLQKIKDLELKLEPSEMQIKEYLSQIEILETENEVLKSEITRWQQRSQQLIEQVGKKQQTNDELQKVLLEKDTVEKEFNLLSSEHKSQELKISECNVLIQNLQADQRQLQEEYENLLREHKNYQDEQKHIQEDAKHLQIEMQKMKQQNIQLSEEKKQNLDQQQQLQKDLNLKREEIEQIQLLLIKKDDEIHKIEGLNETIHIKTEVIQQKEHEIFELQKNIRQIKNIGRKYKTQYEQLQAKYEELNSLHEAAKEHLRLREDESGTSIEYSHTVINDAEKPNMDEGEICKMDSSKSEAEEVDFNSKMKIAESRIIELQEELQQKEEMIIKLKSENESLQSENYALAGSGEGDDRTRRIFQNARHRIQELTAKCNGLAQENKRLQKAVQDLQESQLSSIDRNESVVDTNEVKNVKQQLESRITQLEKECTEMSQQKGQLILENEELRSERINVNRDIESLQQKLSFQQKQLETLQKQQQQQSGKLNITGCPLETPPTANIRPMATPIPAATKSSLTPTPSMVRSTPTASIRPIAQIIQQTRTATVQPTSQSTNLDVSSYIVPIVTESQAGPSSIPQAAVQPTLVPRWKEEESFCIPLSSSLETEDSESQHSSTVALVTPQPHEVFKRIRVSEEEGDGDLELSAKKIKTDSFNTQTEQLLGDQEEKDLDIITIDTDEEIEQEIQEDNDECGDSELEGETEDELDQELIEELEEEEEEEDGNDEDSIEGAGEDSHSQMTAEDDDDVEVTETTPTNIRTTTSDVDTSLLGPPITRHIAQSTQRNIRQYMTLLGSGQGQYEETVDDRAVPSTPTLFIQNQREDGFAEAVSSPQVPSQHFVFGENTSPDIQESVTDNTGAESSQLEDNNSGRNVPSAPTETAHRSQSDQNMQKIESLDQQPSQISTEDESQDIASIGEQDQRDSFDDDRQCLRSVSRTPSLRRPIVWQNGSNSGFGVRPRGILSRGLRRLPYRQAQRDRRSNVSNRGVSRPAF